MSMTSPGMNESDIPLGEGRYGQLDYVDKKMLCSLACQCMFSPNKTYNKKGEEINLKQICMSNKIDLINNETSDSLIYKAEVSYDMTQVPPQPILESNPPLGKAPQKHRYWLGWLKKYWDDPEMDRPKYKKGMIRRPDIIIVHDAQDSPVQRNIKQVVEVKFPNDPIRDGQERNYIKIAGGRDKLVFLYVDKCGCNESDHQRKPVNVPARATSPATETSSAYRVDPELAEAENGLIASLLVSLFGSVIMADAMTSR